MNRLILPIFILALGHHSNAQTLGNSPYSSYGIGDQKYDNSVETKAMGGIATAYVSDFNNHFNFQNPAANQNLEITSLKIQGTNENQFLKSNQNSKHNSAYISGISLAFPLSKSVKFGLGYQPYSSKDYNIINDEIVDGITERQHLYGNGSINLLQAAVGYTITPEFSLGLNTNLYFGKLYDNEAISNSGSTLIDHSEHNVSLNSFNFTLGSVYQKKLKNNKKLTLGATYTFGNTSDFEHQFSQSTYYISNSEKIYTHQLTQDKQKVKNTLPQEFSLGVGYGHDAKWFISSQIQYKNGVNNTTAVSSDFSYQNAYKISAGGWYLPNYNNFRNYFSRVTYRYGAFYEKGNLKVDGIDINRYGIGLGASFPFQKSNINRMSSIDLALELGQRGTLKNNLVRENFVNLTIGINFANKWFEKQYYD